MNVKKMIAKIFTLPSEEKRLVRDPIKQVFFPHYPLAYNHSYIYYLAFKYSLYICAFFSFLNWASLNWATKFNFFFFEISIPQKGFNEALFYSYSYYITPILWLLIVPYFLVLFKKNVDWKNFDPEATAPEDSKIRQFSIEFRYKKAKQIFLVCLLTTPFLSVGLSWPYKGFHIDDSYIYFALCLITLPILHAVFVKLLVMSLTLCLRYRASNNFKSGSS